MDRRKRQFAAVLAALLVSACAGPGQSSETMIHAAVSGAPSEGPSGAPPSSSPIPSPTLSPSATHAPSPAPSNAAVTLSPISGPLVDAGIEAIEATPTGYALVGWQDDRRFIATSADGRTWRALSLDALGGRLAGLAGGQSGWMAVTATGANEATAQPWRSDDGRTWRPLGSLSWLDPGYGATVAAGRLGFAIEGSVIRMGNQVSSGAVSRDGVTWHEAPAIGGASVSRIVITDAGFLVLGANDVQLSADGSTWRAVSPIEGGPLSDWARGSLMSWTGSQLLFFGVDEERTVRGWLGTVTFGSAPHVDWRSIDPAIFSSAGIVIVASTPDRVLVLGYARSDLRPIAWTLSGGSWRRTPLPPTTFGGGVTDLVAGTAAGFVAVGAVVGPTGRSVPNLWRSDDGVAWSRVDDDLLGTLPPPPTGPCPSASTTTYDVLVAMNSELRQVCFVGERLTIEGNVTGCGGCGGTSPYSGQPAWLNGALGYADFWLSRTALVGDMEGSRFGAWIDPARPITVPAEGTRVRVVGHFNDPASSTCRLVPDRGIAAVPPAGLVEAGCRSRFVVESLEVLAP